MRFPDPEAAFTISFAELEGMLATADAVDTLLKHDSSSKQLKVTATATATKTATATATL